MQDRFNVPYYTGTMCKGAFHRKPLLALLALLVVLYVPLVALRTLYPIRFVDLVNGWSHERELDPALVASIIRAESRFHPEAISPRGALGLMQITPDTGAWIAGKIGFADFETDSLLDPDTNVELGTWYISYLIGRFEKVETALAAYNAGPGAVTGWEGDPNAAYPTTTAYVRRVISSTWVYRLYFRLPFLVTITPSLGLSVAETRSVS